MNYSTHRRLCEVCDVFRDVVAGCLHWDIVVVFEVNTGAVSIEELSVNVSERSLVTLLTTMTVETYSDRSVE